MNTQKPAANAQTANVTHSPRAVSPPGHTAANSTDWTRRGAEATFESNRIAKAALAVAVVFGAAGLVVAVLPLVATLKAVDQPKQVEIPTAPLPQVGSQEPHRPGWNASKRGEAVKPAQPTTPRANEWKHKAFEPKR